MAKHSSPATRSGTLPARLLLRRARALSSGEGTPPPAAVGWLILRIPSERLPEERVAARRHASTVRHHAGFTERKTLRTGSASA